MQKFVKIAITEPEVAKGGLFEKALVCHLQEDVLDEACLVS
jgi:hypothetical protein